MTIKQWYYDQMELEAVLGLIGSIRQPVGVEICQAIG